MTANTRSATWPVAISATANPPRIRLNSVNVFSRTIDR